VKVTRRFLFVGCALLAGSAAVFAAGEYQQARDGKTMVWNATPKAGDAASWSGGRDKDNYATGFGDLTWYNASGKEVGLFYGNMVRGKFEGAVNVHTGGRTMHAYYANGGRVTAWARGRAPSKMQVPEEALAEKRKAEAEKEAKRPEPEPTPVIKKAKPATETTIAKTEPTPRAPVEHAGRGPDSYHKETAEKPAATAAASTPTAGVPQEIRDQKAEVSMQSSTPNPAPARTFAEPSAIAKSTPFEPRESAGRPTPGLERAITESSPPAVMPQATVEETPPVLHQAMAEQTPDIRDGKSDVSEKSQAGPDSSSATPESSQPSTLNPEPSSKETPADVSVSALVGPPSSLRTNPVSESSPAKTEPELSPTPKPEGPLTESDVINLVDTEARVEGAPLDQYDRPKVDHSAVKGKWTLFYSRKSDASADVIAGFSATVDDKTRKVEIRR
jgi:hypothetical protein